MDTVSAERRSEIMRRIRSKNTNPELLVRSSLHKLGLRFRVHYSDLPGRPDIVFPRRRICIFVHGCFWHGCTRCIDGRRRVKSKAAYWRAKIAGNRRRDRRSLASLRRQGWRVFVIWGCQVDDPRRLRRFAERIAGHFSKPI